MRFHSRSRRKARNRLAREVRGMHCVERDVIEDGESEDVVERQGGMRVPNGHGCSLFSLVVAVLGQA